jgi:dihydrofolate reductase
MGKNTYFSLPKNIRPLKNRLNIVLTTNINNVLHINNENNENNNLIFTSDDKIYNSIINYREKYINTYSYLNTDFKIFFIGGKKIYEKYIPLCEKVWVTYIKQDYCCDLIFNYDYLNEFKEPEIIEDDDELKIILYKKNNNKFINLSP